MFDCFIKIDGIEGESADDKHTGWIEVLLYDTSISQKDSSTASSVGGASAERADFGTFNFTKELDKASPKLALACADGTHINTIVLEICRAGGDKLKFMEYKLTNCIICDVHTTGAGGDLPFEILKISFGKIEWSYVQQKRASGGAAGNIAAGWNLEKNCKV
jgi:type VI secretion system secreted protein Hcp